MIIGLLVVEYGFALAGIAFSQMWGLGLYGSAGVTLVSISIYSMFTGGLKS